MQLWRKAPLCLWGAPRLVGLGPALVGSRSPRDQLVYLPLALCSFQEDPRAPQQRLHKQLVEHLRQSWGPLGAPTQVRDLGEMLQAWGARAMTGVPKGSRFTHSEKFTFHLVGRLEWTGLVRIAYLRIAFCMNTIVIDTGSGAH